MGILLAGTLAAPGAEDRLMADFEGETYGDWRVSGEAFGPGPARGTLPHQQAVSGFVGNGLANSYFSGDGATGTLTSPPFEIERKYLTFLIGGGAHPGKTCMNLLVNGEVVRTAVGPNTQSGGSEQLDPHCWDVSDLHGQTAILQIVDQATGVWGHVNIDQIVQSDAPPIVPDFQPRELAFTIQHPFLVMPIDNRATLTELTLAVDGIPVRQYSLPLATHPEQVDWYAFFTLAAYQGKPAEVTVARATQEAFALVRPADAVPGAESWYREPHRPQFHFTQQVGWNNDPNGMVYHQGVWHLFFQHNPVALPWGNMTWGHAISRDLLHWEQQPDKLFPRTMLKGDAFSGGGTVDRKNTAGWGQDALVVFYTDTGAGESVAYSTDGGDTFTPYEQNPVVKHLGRDPKVIWYAYDPSDTPLNDRARDLGGHWVMAVYDEEPRHGGRNAAFYTSTNLKEWTEQSHLPGYFECTELFELPVDGDAADSRWVVFAADARYAVGQFDGRTFTPDHEGKHQVHWGPYYASQTFDNAPDGRRIQVGWLQIDSPGPYNQHFSFPHRLTLRRTDDGIRLFARPIVEIERLRIKSREAPSQALGDARPLALPVTSDLLDIRLTVDVGDAASIVLEIPGGDVTYDVTGQRLNEAPLQPIDGRISLQVLVDRSLAEIIGNDGRVYITSPREPVEVSEIRLVAHGGNARVIRLEAHELKSIWPAP